MNSRVALITFLDGGLHPDNALPGQGLNPVDPGFGVRPPVDPGYGRPGYGGGYPSHGLPGSGNYPSHQPVFPPVGPDNTLPEGGEEPVVSLPIILPEGGNKPVRPETRFELKYSVRFGWVLVPSQDESAQPKY
jgi:hypothetical protein